MNFNSFIVFILLGIIVFPTNLVAQKRGGKNRSIVLNDKGSKLSILSKVVNEKKHPLPYTPIEVYSATDSLIIAGGKNDYKGLFELKVPKVVYYLQISFYL